MLGVMVFNSVLNAGEGSAVGESVPLLLMAAGFAFSGVLLLPSAGFGLLRILNKPSPVKWGLRRPGWLILVVLVLVGLGYLTAQSKILTWIALPIIHVMTIGLSVLWLVALGTRGLQVGSQQRVWGIFGTGMVVAPLLSLLAEAVVIIVIGVLGVSVLARDPLFAEELVQITESYIANPDRPPEAILELFEPYWMEPVTIYGVLLVAAVLVPLIEEFFKPVGVWLLVGRRPTPAQGFAAGVLSGAGFALFETLAMSAGTGSEWSLVVVARIGTSIIHISTAGLTGWALALAWQEKRYFRLGLAYFSAVSIHALWNGLVVFTIIPEFWPDAVGTPKILANIGVVSPPVFLILLGGGFVLLLGCNASLRRAIIPPAHSGYHEQRVQSEKPETLEKPQPCAQLARTQPGYSKAESIEEEVPNNGNHH